MAASATRPATRWLWRVVERLTHPGITRHYWYRKRWIEVECVRALQHDVRRVIVIGAGLDTLALRLAPAWPQVQWIELDHPATQKLKRDALNRDAIALPDNLALHAVDLSATPLPTSLLEDPRPTLVVLEGVLMYLSEPEVITLLHAQLCRLSTRPLLLIFSHMVRWPDGTAGFRPASKWVDRWLAWRAEPFRWTIAPAELPAWLERIGFSILAQAEPPFSDPAHAPTTRHLQGENLVLCLARQLAAN